MRVKAHTMAMLGEEQGGSAMRGAGSSDLPEPAEREEGRRLMTCCSRACGDRLVLGR